MLHNLADLNGKNGSESIANAEGKLVFVNPDAEGVINGAMIS